MTTVRRFSIALALTALFASPRTAAALSPPAFLFDWGAYGSGPGQFIHLWGFGLDGSGNVFAADAGNHRIQKFTSGGSFLTAWGSKGSGNGQFSFPLAVACDASGNVYVTDNDNHRVQKFDNSGAYLSQWGTAGAGDGQFSGPVTGIAIDGSGFVYVCDSYNERIQKFTDLGAFVTKWGTAGTGDGQFTHPTAIAVGPSGNIYVLDSFFSPGGRVEVFSSSGAFLSKWGVTGTADSEFVAPRGLAVDGAENVYVSDYTLCRVEVFSSTGAFLTQWGTQGTGSSQFLGPLGLAARPSGTVYVADIEANLAKVFGSSSFQLYPTPISVDWHKLQPPGLVRFHLRWQNDSPDMPSLPVTGSLFPQPFGVFLPDGATAQGFDVPSVEPGSFQDVYVDVPLDQLPPTAPLVLPGGGPPAAGGPCPPLDEWNGNVDVRWTEAGRAAQSDWHGGQFLVGTGLGFSYIHITSDCTPVDSLTWDLIGGCPGFTAMLFEEDRVTPAPASLPAGWTGYLAVSADPGTPAGAVCCYDLFFRCDGDPARVHVCASACEWATTGVDAPRRSVGFGIRSIAPNPAQRSTWIRYSLPRDGPATLDVFNTKGQRVRTIADGVGTSGDHFVVWDGRDAAGRALRGGVYFLRLRAGGLGEAMKIELAR
jgi:DNA-binding beta-propeller fold protein YncE